MKTTIAIIAILFASCTQPAVSNKQSPSDTVNTWATYQINGVEARTTAVIRIEKDTLSDFKVDSFTTTKKVSRDTSYFVPVLDTARIKNELGVIVPKVDSLGKVQMQITFVPLERKFVLHDFNKK